MSDVVVYNTGDDSFIEHIQSVNDSDYQARSDVVIYLDSNVSAVESIRNLVATVPAKYLRHDAGTIREMTGPEKTAVDSAEATAQTNANRSEAVAIADAGDGDGVRIRALIELLNKRDNYIINRLIELQNRVQAMLDSSGNLAAMKTDGLAVSISATETRTKADAVQDYKDDINAGNQDT